MMLATVNIKICLVFCFVALFQYLVHLKVKEQITCYLLRFQLCILIVSQMRTCTS